MSNIQHKDLFKSLGEERKIFSRSLSSKSEENISAHLRIFPLKLCKISCMTEAPVEKFSAVCASVRTCVPPWKNSPVNEFFRMWKVNYWQRKEWGGGAKVGRRWREEELLIMNLWHYRPVQNNTRPSGSKKFFRYHRATGPADGALC